MGTLDKFPIMPCRNRTISSNVLDELQIEDSLKNLSFELIRMNIDISNEEKVVRLQRLKKYCVTS